MTTYRILIPDPVIGAGLDWPPGVRLAAQLEPGTAGTHWYLLDDPEAPEELEGREVSLAMSRGEDGEPVITARRLIAVHLAGEDGDLLCCALEPWDVPPADRVTRDPQAATCAGDRAAALAGGGA